MPGSEICVLNIRYISLIDDFFADDFCRCGREAQDHMMVATRIQSLHLVTLTHDKAHRLFQIPIPLVSDLCHVLGLSDLVCAILTLCASF